MPQAFDIIKTKKIDSNVQLNQKKNRYSLNLTRLIPLKKTTRVSFGVVSLMLSISFIGIFLNYRQDVVAKAALAKIAASSGNYLVIFQNDAELRPSGGFIGSYATVEWNRGIKNIDFGTNIYKVDGAFEQVYSTDPPKPIVKYLGVEKWAMRDSNWALDFRDAAKNVSWFYKMETNKETDGVVAINTQAIVDLIKLTGPIEIKDKNLILDAGNFRQVIQYQVEKKYYQDEASKIDNEPKAILSDLIPILEQKAKNIPAKKLYQYAMEQLSAKNIQLYSKDEIVENSILQYNWGGAIRKADQDYLYINRANLNGQKSSKNVAENVSYKVSDQGQSELLITRTHTGDGSWPDGKNRTYYRLVVP